MKNKKIIIYVLCMLLPTTIFLIAAGINGFVPFGSEMLNAYDSFTQYSGMLLEYSRLLKAGNIFYSWGAGLGFNFLGTWTYYCASPLNLFSLLATPQNFHIFFAIMTYVRFMLLGGSMCFYLSHKDIKPLYIVLFSTIYALMGYTSTYYYNYIWIDSVIMLPLVIHGLDKLLNGDSPTFYIVTLCFTILINYYIGYMICIFSLIWFLYNLINVENKKAVTKSFLTSSLIAGLIGSIVILPSFFALMTGKADLYSEVKYLGVSRNIFSFFYSFTAGAYQTGDQGYGPALFYVTVMTTVLCFFYFFNKSFSKKEKMATLGIVVFFYLSFSVNFINYAWQFFQKPIWWQSRFSFVFSFFMITVAYRTLMNIDKTDFKMKHRLILLALCIPAILIGAIVKWQVNNEIKIYTYIFLFLSILIAIEMFFFLDKKKFLPLLIFITFVELGLNTYNSLKNNYKNMSYKDYLALKEELPIVLDNLSNENDDFYRLELADAYTLDDGLYFGYNGINYFNSAKNSAVFDLAENLGVAINKKCRIELTTLDPIVLSLLNVKYIYGDQLPYFKEADRNLSENPYPLGLGFMVDSATKDVSLDPSKPYENKEEILKSASGLDEDLYTFIGSDEFEMSTEDYFTVYKTSFRCNREYLLMPEFTGYITIDGEKSHMNGQYIVLEKGQQVTIEYRLVQTIEQEEEIKEISATMLDLANYRTYMEALSQNVMSAKTNTSPTTILEGSITSDGKYDYLFTSIEFEQGMNIYVDGEKIEPDIVYGALIGFPLEEGEHTIKITYIPKGLIAGSALSCTGLAACLFYLQRRKKVI